MNNFLYIIQFSWINKQQQKNYEWGNFQQNGVEKTLFKETKANKLKSHVEQAVCTAEQHGC